jgi:spore coat protein U-like protein
MRVSHFKQLSKLASVLAVVALSQNVQAQTVSANMTVSANVQTTCSIGTIAPLNFGDYFPLSGDKTGSTTVSVTCGAGVGYSIGMGGAASGGPRDMVGPSAAVLTFELFRDSAFTQTWGSGPTFMLGGLAGNGDAQEYTVYGRIPDSASNRTAVPGAYTATVSVLVNY